MSSSHPEEPSNPESELTAAELGNLDRLEAIAHHGLRTYVQVGGALAEIRDRHLYRETHPSFEAYLRDRWAVNVPQGELSSSTTGLSDAEAASIGELESPAALLHTQCEALARACEETLTALAGHDRVRIDIHVDVGAQDPDATADGVAFDRVDIANPIGGGLLARLRWLLSEASGTVGLIAYQLESHAADLDDVARVQLQDDVLVLDDELATVKTLLLEPIDWDSELGRLVEEELPPLDSDADPDEDD